jgi:hypothetical protein
MAGLVPAIHDLACLSGRKTWMPGTRPGLTADGDEPDKTMTRKRTKLIREGKYAADVTVDLIEDETAWSPYLSAEDVDRLDTVRLALRRGDVAAAARYGRVFELTPVSE